MLTRLIDSGCAFLPVANMISRGRVGSVSYLLAVCVYVNRDDNDSLVYSFSLGAGL